MWNVSRWNDCFLHHIPLFFVPCGEAPPPRSSYTPLNFWLKKMKSAKLDSLGLKYRLTISIQWGSIPGPPTDNKIQGGAFRGPLHGTGSAFWSHLVVFCGTGSLLLPQKASQGLSVSWSGRPFEVCGDCAWPPCTSEGVPEASGRHFWFFIKTKTKLWCLPLWEEFSDVAQRPRHLRSDQKPLLVASRGLWGPPWRFNDPGFWDLPQIPGANLYLR